MPPRGFHHRRITKRYANPPKGYLGNGETSIHRLICERALGKPLPSKAVVHHFDGIKHNNAHQNLVVCQNAGYHNVLHRRQRALEACGHAGWLICRECKQYDRPENLHVYNSRKNRIGVSAFHLSCARKASRAKNLARWIAKGGTAENWKKPQTHCKSGHALLGDNLYLHPNGSRLCRICKLDYFRSWYKGRQRRVEINR